MKTRFAAATIAVMSAVAFADASAQNFIPRGPELNYVKPGGSVLPCSTHAIFTDAVRGNPLCDKAPSVGESSAFGGNDLFLDERGHSGKFRTVKRDHPKKDHDDQQNGRADDHLKGWQKGGAADDAATDPDDWQNGPADQPEALSLALLQAEPAALEVTATPEPGSFVLMATGLVGVAVYRRRRAKGREGINN